MQRRTYRSITELTPIGLDLLLIAVAALAGPTMALNSLTAATLGALPDTLTGAWALLRILYGLPVIACGAGFGALLYERHYPQRKPLPVAAICAGMAIVLLSAAILATVLTGWFAAGMASDADFAPNAPAANWMIGGD